MKKPLILVFGGMPNHAEHMATAFRSQLATNGFQSCHVARLDNITSEGIKNHFSPLFNMVERPIRDVMRELTSFVGSNPWYEPRETLSSLGSLVTNENNRSGSDIAKTTQACLDSFLKGNLGEAYNLILTYNEIPSDCDSVILFGITDYAEVNAIMVGDMFDEYDITLVKLETTPIVPTDSDPFFHYIVSTLEVDYIRQSSKIIVTEMMEARHAE